MRPSRVLLSIVVLSSCAGIGVLPDPSGLCRGQSYYVPSYYAAAYYPSTYYSTGYYPTYYSSAYYPTYYSSGYYPTSYSSAYYPTYYSSAYYPTYYSSAYYPAYYSSAYYPTYYSSAYYPTYYSSGYYPTYYSSAYYPTYYSSGYYYPTYYPSSYYYPTTYYSTGYYLGKADKARDTALPDTMVASTNRRRTLNDTRRLVDRPVLARNATANDPTRYQPTPDVVASDRQTAPKSVLVRRTTYQAAAVSVRDDTQSPPVVSKTPPAVGSGRPAGAGAGAAKDATKPDGAAPAKKGTPQVAPGKVPSEPPIEPAPPLDGAPNGASRCGRGTKHSRRGTFWWAESKAIPEMLGKGCGLLSRAGPSPAWPAPACQMRSVDLRSGSMTATGPCE